MSHTCIATSIKGGSGVAFAFLGWMGESDKLLFLGIGLVASVIFDHAANYVASRIPQRENPLINRVQVLQAGPGYAEVEGEVELNQVEGGV